MSNCELTVICQGERARRAIIASMIEPTDASENLSEQDIRTELDRLLRSGLFLQSDRLARFLRFAIENALAGNTDLLKEYVIGTEVYDRKPPYHPSQDSIVRTEARRLRAKLKDYYESEGKHDPVFIYFRPGTYVPLFRRNESVAAASPHGDTAESNLLVRGDGVGVAVLPFIDLSNRPRSALCAQGVTEELIHTLSRADGIRLIARPSAPQLVEAPQDIPSLSQKYGLSTVIEGTVREDFDRLRITARVLGSDGFQLSSHRFDTEANGEALAQVQERIASAFVSRAQSGAIAGAPAKGGAERADHGRLSPGSARGDASGRRLGIGPACFSGEISGGEGIGPRLCAGLVWHLPLQPGDSFARRETLAHAGVDCQAGRPASH